MNLESNIEILRDMALSNQKQSHALNLAIKIISKENERRKGCDVCNNGAILGWDLCNDGIHIDSDGKMKFLCGGDWELPITYCPKCGRRLSDTVAPETPLTLDEVKKHIITGHPHEVQPLYVVFTPQIPLDYASPWRDAYNLSQLISTSAEEYGKTWVAYRHSPNNFTKEN